jgi:hypothetical protein
MAPAEAFSCSFPSFSQSLALATTSRNADADESEHADENADEHGVGNDFPAPR